MRRTIVIGVVALCLTVGGIVVAGCAAICTGDDALLKGIDPSVRLGLHLGLGESAFEGMQFGLAETQFKKALADSSETGIKTDKAECLTRLGQTSSSLGKTAEAKTYLQQAYEVYQDADDEFMFSIDKRVKKQCLEEYARVLKETGDEKLAATISEEYQKVRENLGPAEKLREKMQQF